MRQRRTVARSGVPRRGAFLVACLLLPAVLSSCRGDPVPPAHDEAGVPAAPTPVLTRAGAAFLLDGQPIAPFGLRAVNALQSDATADRLIDALGALREHGMQSVVIGLQGGRHTEGGNSAFSAFDVHGALSAEHRARLARVLDATAARQMVAVVNLFYQGRDQELADDEAIRRALRATLAYIEPWRHAWVHVINEPGHPGFDHPTLTSPDGQRTLYRLARELDSARVVFVSHVDGANDGFLADTWGRHTGVTPPGRGDVSIEYARSDAYDAPGSFTPAQRDAAVRDATEAARHGGYWFWHAAWHQKADADGWPRFDAGGAGTDTDPGVAFIWEAMRALASRP